MNQFKQIICFLLASLLLSSAVYRDALWGQSLLAPLDIGPDLFAQYKFMDPDSDGIPENHHIIDQFTYDLPLQQAIYRAYRSGEIPWWDPYTYGGRPLLADAHINGTDPIRVLCYSILPFELAYNWNYIIRGCLTGLGMFLLLRTLKVGIFVASILAITYQFAGWFSLYFGHPWVQGSFVYFPFIWVLWLRALDGDFRSTTAFGGILCGFVFYAGNLQSHVYLPIFAIAFAAAVFIKSREKFPRAVAACAVCGVIGGLLSFPVLANEIEFYKLSLRSTSTDAPWYSHLAAINLSFSAFYPWSLGTFRTLDLAKFAGGVPGFNLFMGTVAMFLALAGVIHLRKEKGLTGMVVYQSAILIGVFFLIVCSPLAVILYSRCACLAGMGLTVLSGVTTQAILDGKVHFKKKLIFRFVGMIASIALLTSSLAWFVFPKFEKKIYDRISKDGAGSTSYSAIPSIAKTRTFQVKNFTKEVSLQNPEIILTVLATLLFGYASTVNELNKKAALVITSLCLSAVPVVMFHARFRPKQPIQLWHRMLEGGIAQQNAIKELKGGRRIDETSTKLSDMIFPNALAALYQVHGVAGYSALQPCSLFRYPPDSPPLNESWKADVIGQQNGKLQPTTAFNAQGLSRFRWTTDGSAAKARVIKETFNTLTLEVSKVRNGDDLIRTDTWYPGWNVSRGMNLDKLPPCFSKISPIKLAESETLHLKYTPTYQKTFLPLISAGLLLTVTLLVSSSDFIKRRFSLYPSVDRS